MMSCEEQLIHKKIIPSIPIILLMLRGEEFYRKMSLGYTKNVKLFYNGRAENKKVDTPGSSEVRNSI